MELKINSPLIYENHLNMTKFSKMLDDPTQCYKFYWLDALLTLLPFIDSKVTFDEIIDEMIFDAWHSVTRYHLRLGPSINGKAENYLEHAIHTLDINADVGENISKEQILDLISKNEEKIKYDKQMLIRNVPYRLLSSFLDRLSGNDRLWDQKTRLIAYVEAYNKRADKLPYIFSSGTGVNRKIQVEQHWKQLMLDNYSVLKDWIRYKKACYLQDRNPGVPAIIYKIENDTESLRKLSNARQLWIEWSFSPGNIMRDIYSGERLEKNKFDLDHFVPWSYIANDELWDLSPMDSRLNSQKGNRLPQWNQYFKAFADVQYSLYEGVFNIEKIHECFEKCRRDNLNAIWASQELYIPGNSREQFINVLEHNLKPLYDAALLQGYSLWNNGEGLYV